MRNFIDAFVVSTHQKLKAFRKSQLGSITQIAAVAVVPMFLCAGAAIDTVRINREQVAFNGAVDSAALAMAADDRASLAGLLLRASRPPGLPSLKPSPGRILLITILRSLAAARTWTWMLTSPAKPLT